MSAAAMIVQLCFSARRRFCSSRLFSLLDDGIMASKVLSIMSFSLLLPVNVKTKAFEFVFSSVVLLFQKLKSRRLLKILSL